MVMDGIKSSIFNEFNLITSAKNNYGQFDTFDDVFKIIELKKSKLEKLLKEDKKDKNHIETELLQSMALYLFLLMDSVINKESELEWSKHV